MLRVKEQYCVQIRGDTKYIWAHIKLTCTDLVSNVLNTDRVLLQEKGVQTTRRMSETMSNQSVHYFFCVCTYYVCVCALHSRKKTREQAAGMTKMWSHNTL